MPIRQVSRRALVLSLALLCLAPGAATAQDAGDAARQAVRAALDAGNALEAVALAERAVEQAPESPELLVLLGHAYRADGRLPAAAQVYARAAELDPNQPEVLLGQGALYDSVNDAVAALRAYERAAELAPDFAAAHRLAGIARMRAGDRPRAAEHLTRYLDLQPDDLEARYLLGVSEYFNGNLDTAIAVLAGALERDPDYAPAAYTLGVVYADRPESLTTALPLLRQAATAGWEPIESRYLVGRVLADLGRLDAAVGELRGVVETDDSHRDAHYRLSQALVRLGRRDEAAVHAARFRELQQQFNEREAHAKRVGTLQNDLATALAAGDRNAALGAAAALVEQAPEDPAVLVRAAKVWISSADLSLAYDAVSAATQLDTGNWEGFYLLGLLELQGERPRDALRALTTSITLNPLFPDARSLLGNAYMLLGAPRDAVAAYLAAIELEADNAAYWFNLAAAYRELGRGDLERAALDRYRRLTDTVDEPR